MPSLPTAPSTIQLRYAQLEQLVADLLDAHSDRRSPLLARFRLFRQRGFPSNYTALSKTLFVYGLDAALQVVIGFWMMEAGVAQESVPPIMEANGDQLREGLRRSFALIRAVGSDAAAVDDGRPVLLMQPNNLKAFALPKGAEALPAETVAVRVVDAREAQDTMFGGRSFEPVILIDLHRLADWVRSYFLAAGWCDDEPFAAYPD